MNILHLSHTDINSDSRILKEMNSIKNINNNYVLIGLGVRLNEKLYTKRKERLNIHSIDLRSRKWKILPAVVRRTFSLVELMAKMILKSIKIKPKVVHCHDVAVLPLGVIIKFLTGSKLIYDAHELESNRNGLSKTLGKMTLLVEKQLWRFIDALIVVSPSIEKWYKDTIGKKYSKVILNSPIVLNNNMNYDHDYLRNKFSIPLGMKIFLYIGILGKGRGIELITTAFKKDDIKSHLVFLGYGDYKEELKQLKQECNNIHVHDVVPHEQVVPIAKSADVGLCFIQNVSLSDYYCLPNKLFEYAFSEIPILASDFPDILDTVNRYNLGMCSDLDSESVHSAIKKYEELDKMPKINVDDLYGLSWAAQEEKLIELYKYTVNNTTKKR
jgi:glycosyltransferase involved in cell wall biosynthesis